MIPEPFQKSPIADIPIEEFFRQVLYGIIFLHNKVGLVHGDIKPANIMLQHNVDGSYTPVIIDLGAAGVPNERRRQSTPLFLSRQGKTSGVLMLRDDLHALAVTILYVSWWCNQGHLQGTEFAEFSWSTMDHQEDHDLLMKKHKMLWRDLWARTPIQQDVAKFVDYYVEERWDEPEEFVSLTRMEAELQFESFVDDFLHPP